VVRVSESSPSADGRLAGGVFYCRRQLLIPNAEQLAEVYYDTSLTVVQVAQHFGVNRHRIKDWVKKHGLKGRKELGICRRVHDLPTEKIEAALAEYESVSGASAALGVDWTVIKHRMKANGIQMIKQKYSSKSCHRCEHLAWCQANPHADKLPCEFEPTPYAPGGLTVNPSARFGGGLFDFDRGE